MVTALSERYRSLADQELRVLNAVERGMQHRDWVPIDDLPGLARLAPEDVDHALDALNDAELVQRRLERREEYRLTFPGYDVLALHAHVESDVVAELGGVVNEGKESEIVAARGDGERLVVKFHREGYSSFRDVDRTRDYADEKDHVSWVYRARKAAEREHEVMRALYPDVSLPRPVAQNRHTVVLEQIEAAQLSAVAVDEPVAVFEVVVEQIAAAWRGGYVHADVSEYNVMVASDAVHLIDWPQAVAVDHPHADELLERDVANLRSYVLRKYPDVELPVVEAVIDDVTG